MSCRRPGSGSGSGRGSEERALRHADETMHESPSRCARGCRAAQRVVQKNASRRPTINLELAAAATALCRSVTAGIVGAAESMPSSRGPRFGQTTECAMNCSPRQIADDPENDQSGIMNSSVKLLPQKILSPRKPSVRYASPSLAWGEKPQSRPGRCGFTL